MPFLLAQDVRNVEQRFIELLGDMPGDKETKQNYFDSLKISVPRTNYHLMWHKLVDRVGRASAGEAVFDYLLYSADDRLKELLAKVRQGFPVGLQKSEPKTVADLFFRNGNLKRLGELLVTYIEASGHRRVPQTDEGLSSSHPPEVSMPYDVALSFAGEDREYVERVAECLRKKGMNVFYDRFRQIDLWGKDLYVHLDEIYRREARYCVMFLSKDYARKAWPSHERASAQARALQQPKEYILPVRLDDTEIPGMMPTIGYVDAREYKPEEIAEMIAGKCSKKQDLVSPVEERGGQDQLEILFQLSDLDLLLSDMKNRKRDDLHQLKYDLGSTARILRQLQVSPAATNLGATEEISELADSLEEMESHRLYIDGGKSWREYLDKGSWSAGKAGRLMDRILKRLSLRQEDPKELMQTTLQHLRYLKARWSRREDLLRRAQLSKLRSDFRRLSLTFGRLSHLYTAIGNEKFSEGLKNIAFILRRLDNDWIFRPGLGRNPLELMERDMEELLTWAEDIEGAILKE